MYHGGTAGEECREIHIDNNNFQVEYVNVTEEESDGAKAVRCFAFMTSLVTLAKRKANTNGKEVGKQSFPLVMDAPFSMCDSEHIRRICGILPTSANQVIMAVREDQWDFAKESLEKFVGCRYKILKDHDKYGNEVETSSRVEPIDEEE